jgi:predicted ATP-grasp superfamily ATP-dependent carboligase
MASSERVLLVGASVRAAAFSVLRAGLSPWCIDLFGDADLWGNDAATLQACRNPAVVARLLRGAGLPAPALRLPPEIPDPGRRWLVKPVRRAGGAGVHFLEPGERPRDSDYIQEYVEGDSCAALYVGAGPETILLGLTRQLVGVDWLHAMPFHYCGSIGPLPLDSILNDQLERLGRTLAVGCGLVGLFGVDGVLRDGLFWPVEVNPRYTASVEVVEYATGVRALDWHRLACTVGLPPVRFVPAATKVVGKAILFASDEVVFPAEGPWEKELRSPSDPWRLPTHADIPAAGTAVRTRQPILTVLTPGETLEAVTASLRRTVGEVELALRS